MKATLKNHRRLVLVEKQLRLKTGKQKSNKAGFTLLESIFVISIMIVCLNISVYLLPKNKSLRLQPLIIVSEVLKKQTEAMLTNEETEVYLDGDSIDEIPLNADLDGNDITINGKGNVNMAQTITLSNEISLIELKLWLGAGRMEYDEIES